MAAKQKTVEAQSEPGDRTSAEPNGVWVGEHTIDGDVLILDSTDGDRISYYSLTQLRRRVFPRSTAESMIRQLTDDDRLSHAQEQYARRGELEAAAAEARVTERADLVERQRDQVVRLHERYMDGHGLQNEGVRETPGDHKSRRSKCHACGISLDDFAGVVCVTCNEVLCSCGACGCGR